MIKHNCPIQNLLSFIILILIISSSAPLHAVEKIIVGTKIAPPFAMQNNNGQWEGISIELWESIASKLNIEFEWKKHDLKSLLNGVTDSSLDVGIAAITVTSDREKRFDFSHSYYSTGLSIAVPKESDNGWANVIKGIFSLRMLQLVLMLFSILTLVGTVTWLVERNKSEYFNTNNPIKGIASGIWLAAVTMTTVGYGDIAPKTIVGKLVTLVWMFTSLLLVSIIIAGVASTLANSKLEPLVSSPHDLARARVASIKSSTSATYLLDRRIKPHYYPTILSALEAMDKNEVDAVVYDAALLKYFIHQNFEKNLRLYDGLFELQFYGIAFPENSKLREPVNRVMLEITQSKSWQDTLRKYLGK
jgi:ABC-type amino acid transport substrate-binding protein